MHLTKPLRIVLVAVSAMVLGGRGAIAGKYEPALALYGVAAGTPLVGNRLQERRDMLG